MGFAVSTATGALIAGVMLVVATGATAKSHQVEFEYMHPPLTTFEKVTALGKRAVDTAAEPRQCPHAAADLEVTGNLDVMLTARASANRDLVIIISGPTSGSSSIRMGALATRMALNMLANLEERGVRNTLTLASHLHIPGHADNNVCISRLRPRGVCCAYAGVGMHLVNTAGASGREWGLSETHPYLLFLQRWWLAAQATARGYNVLSLDTDMHIAVNPLAMVHSASFTPFSVMLQLDSGWPVEAEEEGRRPTDNIGQHEIMVRCPQGEAFFDARSVVKGRRY